MNQLFFILRPSQISEKQIITHVKIANVLNGVYSFDIKPLYYEFSSNNVSYFERKYTCTRKKNIFFFPPMWKKVRPAMISAAGRSLMCFITLLVHQLVGFFIAGGQMWKPFWARLESTRTASHLLHPFLGSLVEDRRGPHQGVWWVWRIAAVWRHARWRGRHGSARLTHGGHGPPLLEHISTQHAVVMVVVMAVMSTALTLLPILRLHFHLWPQWRVVGPTPAW